MLMKVTPTGISMYKQRQHKKKNDDTKFNDNWRKHLDEQKTGKQSEIYLPEDKYKNTKKTTNQAKKRTMSSKTKRKVKDRMIMFYWKLKRRTDKPLITFWTLTLTSKQIGTDAENNKMLNVFFTRLRMIKDFDYSWTAEKQSNGNIHWHIVMTQGFEVQTLNYYWCVILKNYGYTVRLPRFTYQIGSSKVYTSFLFEGGKIESKGCSNPVDFRHVFDLNGLSKYMSKYVTKSKSELECTMYHCSRYFSSMVTHHIAEINEDFISDVLFKNYYVNKKGETIWYIPIIIYRDIERLHEVATYINVVCTDIIEDYFYQYQLID